MSESTLSRVAQASLLLLMFGSFCHIANTPVELQSAHCLAASGSQAAGSAGSVFPCSAPSWRRALHVLSHLHMGLSEEAPALTTQLLMLGGVLLAVVDLLKVWPREHPLLPGRPTTIHSPLRQALSLGVRLGCPLLQIICTWLARRRGQHDEMPYRPGLNIITLQKARTVWLGQTVNASFACAVPYGTQVWAGAVEAVLILSAACWSSARNPTLGESAQILIYSLILYCVPLASVKWQQHRESQQAHCNLGQPASINQSGPQQEVKGRGLSWDGKHAEPSDAACHVSSNGRRGADVLPPSKGQEQGRQREGSRQMHQQRPSLYAQVDQRAQPRSAAPLALSLEDVAAAIAARTPGSTLYTSRLQHDAMSIKVHRPTLSHHATAAALQQALPSILTSNLPGQLASLSSAWVKGCVQMFVWTSHLRNRPASSTSHSSGSAGGIMGQPGTQLPEGQAGQGSERDATTPGVTDYRMLQHQLAASAGEAGAQGAVDVQPTMHHGPARYQLGSTSDAEAALDSSGDSGSAAGLCGVSITDVTPVSLTLPVSAPTGAPCGASFPIEVHLNTQQGQRVRLLLFVALTGAVLVDQEADVPARDGPQTPVLLSIPRAELVAASQRSALTTTDGAPTGSCPEAARSQPVPLRLVVTTPAAADRHQGGSPPPARLLATATLLAAPAPLASELCSLHIAMEQEGGHQGLGTQELWSSHWQPLMDDICLLSTLASGGGPVQPDPAVSLEAVQGMHQFFSHNSMPAWQAEARSVLEVLQRQQAGGQVQCARTGASSTPQVHPHQESAQAGGGASNTAPMQPAAAMTMPQPSSEGASDSKTSGQGRGEELGGAKSCSTAGSSTGQVSSPAGQAAPSRPAAPSSTLVRGCMKGWVQWLATGLHLLAAGFSDSNNEKVWQEDLGVTAVAATDPVGLMCQAGIVIASMTRTPHGDGLMFRWPMLYLGHSAGWVIALLWCMRHVRSRHARAKVFFCAAVNDLAFLAALHAGIVCEPGMLARMARGVKSRCGVAVLRCLLMQGTFKQWVPVGALLSLMWVFPQLSQGIPLAHALSDALVTWLLSCCLAAGLEIWQRTSYLQRRHSQQPGSGGNALGSGTSGAGSGKQLSPRHEGSDKKGN